ncbi:Glutamate--tRNA ligase [compost metagenome]
MVSASDIVELSEMFFRADLNLEEEGAAVLAEEQVNTVLSAFLGKVEELTEFTPENIAARIKEVQKETGVKGKGLFMPIRVALTGQTHGRDLNQTIYLLGKDRAIERLKAQIK